ncbi:hypothetical protein Ancab_028513 [Ancistrocladus abbreviatus]
MAHSPPLIPSNSLTPSPYLSRQSSNLSYPRLITQLTLVICATLPGPSVTSFNATCLGRIHLTIGLICNT